MSVAKTLFAPADLVATTATLLDAVRKKAPRVHCITNAVAQNFTANLLLAAGAVPSMTYSPEEVAEFAARADALLVNLGTLDADRRAATRIAAETAARRGTPWALDPVFVQASAARRALAEDLLTRGPNVLRANEAELAVLVPAAGSADETAMRHALASGTVICRTGPVDFITDGTRALRIANGHRLMASVTAMGCAGTALLCAMLAVERDAFTAAAAAFLALGIAGEIAGERSLGPGSFAVEFLDALYGLTGEQIAARARVD